MPKPRKKPAELLDQRIGVPVSKEQKRLILEAAARDGMGHVTWVRMVALREARKRSK